MCFFLLSFEVILLIIHAVECLQCHVECPVDNKMVCGFDQNELVFKMFSSECARKAFTICSNIEFQAVPLKYCVKNHIALSRRMYSYDDESCPVFCPNYYRPVCGASKYRDYLYRSFTNGCYLDMINCRGDDDYAGYIEVPLYYCQGHAMRNINQEQLVMSNLYDKRSLD